MFCCSTAPVNVKVSEAVVSMKDSHIQPAAIIFDSAFSSDGIIRPPEGFIKKAAEIVRAAGGIYIADEVQAGFYRSANNMWGFQGKQYQFSRFISSSRHCT